MASFFKRAVIGALERRDEVQNANQLKYETDIARGIEKLEAADESMKKNNLVVRNRKKLVTPIGINVFNKTGKQFDEATLTNVLLSSKGDTSLATDTLVRMAETQARPPTATVTGGMEGAAQESASTRDLSDMSGDTTKALQDSANMISTTSTQLPSQQKSLITAKENERTQRYGGGVAGNIMNTLLGGVSGPSVREAVKERYSSIFRTPEEGEQAYTDTMNYMEEVRTKGEASTIPDLPPKMLADIQVQIRKAKKAEVFEAKIGGVIDERLRELRMFIVNKAPSAQQVLIDRMTKTQNGGYKSSSEEINKLPKAVQKQISTYIGIRREAIKGSTDIFNTTGFNSVYGASSNFLDTTIDGKNQLDVYFDRMMRAGGESTSNQSNTGNAPKKSSKPTRKIGNKLIDLSGSTVLSSDELKGRYNVDDVADFHKKYQSRFVGDQPSMEAGKSVGYLKVYNIEGTKIALGNGGKTIRQLP